MVNVVAPAQISDRESITRRPTNIPTTPRIKR